MSISASFRHSLFVCSNSEIARQFMVLLVVTMLCKLGLFFTLHHGNASLFWPQAGFALAVLLRGGPNYIAAIFGGALLGNIITGEAPFLAFVMALGSALECALSLYLLNKFAFFDKKLLSVKDFFSLVICAICTAPISALLGPGCMWLSGYIEQAELGNFMLRWWVGDVLGIVFVTPLLLIYDRSESWLSPERLSEILMLFLLVFGLSGVSDCESCVRFLPLLNSDLIPVWITPLVIWAALRTGPVITALLQLAILIMMLVSAHFGVGYFAQDMAQHGVDNFWMFALMMSITGQAIAINDGERQRLLRRLQLTQFAMDNASVEVYWIKPDGHIVYANQQASRALGYSGEDLLQLTIPDLDPDYSVERWYEHWRQLKTQRVLSFETRHLCKNRHIRPVKVTANYVQFDGLEYNVAYAMDITQQKRAEAALHASEKRFRDLFEHSPDPCWLLNENGRFMACNLAAAILMGFGNTQAPGLHKMSPLFGYLQHDAGEMGRLMALVAEKGVHRFQTVFILPGNRDFPVEVTLTKIYVDAADLLYCVCRDISVQQRVMQHLEKQHRQLVKTEELAHLGSWELDYRTQNLTWSDEVYRIIGISPEQPPTYQAFLQSVHPDDREIVDEMYQESLKKKLDGYEVEHRIIHQATGEVRFLLERCEHVRDKYGRTLLSSGMVQDITEQKRLRQQSERLAHSIAASVNEVYLFDAKSLNFIFVNNRGKEHLGYSLAEMQQLSALAIKPEFTDAQFEALLSPLRHHEKSAQFYKTFHQTKQGERYPVNVHLQLFEPEDDVDYFLAIAVDITEQQQLEAKLSTVYGAINAIVWSADAQLRLEHVSQQVEQMLGFPSHGFSGKCLRELLGSEIFHAEDRDKQLQALDGLLKLGLPVTNLQHRITNSEGDWKWMSVSMSPIYDAKGQLQHIVGVVTDINAQKQAEAALLHLNANLDNRVKTALAEIRRKDILLQQQSRMVGMGEMIGNIAHQWRQPLNALALILMDLEDKFLFSQVSPKEVSETVQRCHQLLEKMSSTIDDFRNFFKKDKVLAPMDLCAAVDEVVSILDAALQYHHIQLHVSKPPVAVTAWGHSGELSQALTCLISNAKDQLVDHHIAQGRIDIVIEETDAWAAVRVYDNGGGVDESVVAKVFDPYFTTKSEGSGLGLYISKLTIEQSMHGLLEYQAIDEGACFSVLLPKSKEV